VPHRIRIVEALVVLFDGGRLVIHVTRINDPWLNSPLLKSK